ncbi:MAG: DUF92 domain-containing protein [Candidatus Zixiibacteriota bacterium]
MNLTVVSWLSLDPVQIIAGAGIACLIAVLAYLGRALTLNGALCLVFIGIIVFGIGGVIFGVPIVFFFISSSLLSRIKSPGKKKSMEAFDKSGPRDYRQVLANGGAAAAGTLFYFITGWSGWYLVYLAAISEACADTWATEIGTLSKKPPLFILTLERVEPGRSGGITLLGTSAALTGSLLTVLAGYFSELFSSAPILSFWSVCLCTLAGFSGAVMDSIIGGTLQAQFRNESTGKITEKPFVNGKINIQIKGFRLVNNDVVNFLSTVFAGGCMVILIYLFLSVK